MKNADIAASKDLSCVFEEKRLTASIPSKTPAMYPATAAKIESRAIFIFAISEYVSFFQRLLSEHVFLQPGVEFDVVNHQDGFCSFGWRIHLDSFGHPDV